MQYQANFINRIYLTVIFLFLSNLLSNDQLLALTSDSIRVAIVYNDSKTGKRYRDGILSALPEDQIKRFKLKIINVPYDKSVHGEDTLKSLIMNDHADVILGPTESEVFTRVYKIDGIEDKKISVISGLATTDVGNDTQGFFFRLNLEASERVSKVWSHMNMYLINNVAVIYEDSEFGKTAESAFNELLQFSSIKLNYTDLSFVSPFEKRADFVNLIKKRPEVIGLFCERDEIPNIYAEIQASNQSGVPYHPYFFTILDITSVGNGLENFYFPSLKVYEDKENINDITMDEVYILGQETGKLLLSALEESGSKNDIRSLVGRAHFRTQVVSILRGDSDNYIGMNFLKMKNLGPPYLYKMRNNKVQIIEEDPDINWITMIQNKTLLLFSVHNYMLILNLLIITVLTISISTIEIRRSFPKKHVKVGKTRVFYTFLLTHLFLVLFLYIFLAETGRINYSDIMMAIIISITPSAFFKTTFFETRSGSSFGLEGVYKRIRAKIDNQIMNSRYRKLVGLENVIAYSNSEDSMKRALRRIYRNNPSKIQSSKLIQKLEEDVSQEKDYMNRKRAAAKLIMTQFDREQLKAEGFVPPYWEYDRSIDPVILLRHAAKYCAGSDKRGNKIIELLDEELSHLKKRNRSRHAEIMSIHDKELSITMSKVGEMLTKLRLLMVIHGFNRSWLIENDLVSEDQWEQLRINSIKKNSKLQFGFGISFVNKKLMKSRYKRRVAFENFIAYSNSVDSMKSALIGVYRYNPSSRAEIKLVKKLEDKLSYGLDLLDRRKILTRLLVKQFSKKQLIENGFVPNDWNFNNTIDPEVLVRYAAKKISEDEVIQKKVGNMLDNEFILLKKRNPKSYEEMMKFYNRDLINLMTQEGELMLKIQILFLFQSFNIDWLIDNGIVLKEWTEQQIKSINSNI